MVSTFSKKSKGSTMSRSYTGFTLVEVLITLGIIGIVAAMTIPNLLNENAKETTIANLKKEYTSFSQAVKRSEQDNGNCGTWDWGDSITVSQSFATYWAPYLNISKYCNTFTDCGYKSNDAINYPHSTPRFGIVEDTEGVTVLLADGSMFKTQYVSGSKKIFIDLNAGRKPNMLGKDVFLFVLDANKGFMPYNFSDLPSNINNICGGGGIYDGMGCAAKIIILDNWQINSDYLWDKLN